MLALRFEFLNLTLDTINPRAARLVRADASKPAIVLVHFPPQSLGERAFFESESPGGPRRQAARQTWSPIARQFPRPRRQPRNLPVAL